MIGIARYAMAGVFALWGEEGDQDTIGSRVCIGVCENHISEQFPEKIVWVFLIWRLKSPKYSSASFAMLQGRDL